MQTITRLHWVIWSGQSQRHYMHIGTFYGAVRSAARHNKRRSMGVTGWEVGPAFAFQQCK